jgi:ribosomal protein S12 methylthiotransferase accessory factor
VSARKAYRAGTDRLVAPEETLRRIEPLLPAMGITRVSDVTGLDSIGIPVYMACRPNSRALSVSQGKGLDPVAARASAIMESVEMFHAERIRAPLVYATHAHMRAHAPVADPWLLPRAVTSPFTDHVPIPWIAGRDVVCGQETYVPYEVTHTDFRHPRPVGSGCFLASSNGLASGNHFLEAASHAICEVIERDSMSIFTACSGEASNRTRVDLSTVGDPLCREALERFDAAGVDVGVWDATSDVGIATMSCRIVERHPDPVRALYDAAGSGCHPRREIALLRAMTEAAQSRVTVIAGSRDDAEQNDYRRLRDADGLRESRAALRSGGASVRFDAVPTFSGETFEDDLAHELGRLRAVGIRQAVLLDLSLPELGVAVVRAVIPGLENVAAVGAGVQPLAGPRLQRLLAAA